MNLKIGQYLSGSHLKSSIFLCNLANGIELENQEDWDEQRRDLKRTAHLSYVSGSILLTYAFLDSAINELLFNITDVKNPSNPVRRQIIDNDSRIFESPDKKINPNTRYGIIKKCDNILQFFNKGKYLDIPGHQELNWFTFIRHRINHYEFEWEDRTDENYTVSEKYEKLEKDVKSKFIMNRISDSNDLFFPHQCLGYGCACWGIKTSVSFMEEFYKTIDIDYPVILLKSTDLNHFF